MKTEHQIKIKLLFKEVELDKNSPDVDNPSAFECRGFIEALEWVLENDMKVAIWHRSPSWYKIDRKSIIANEEYPFTNLKIIRENRDLIVCLNEIVIIQ